MSGETMVMFRDVLSGEMDRAPISTPAFRANRVEGGGEDRPILYLPADDEDAADLQTAQRGERWYVQSDDEDPDDCARVCWYLSEVL